MDFGITIGLYRQPWPDSLPSRWLEEKLLEEARKVQAQIATLIAKKQLEPRKNSFAVVILDPTRPAGAIKLADRILATIKIGPDAAALLPNAAAKADAHDRHNTPNQELIRASNFCLSDGDFAYGNSAEYCGAIAAGSGLSEEQDEAVVEELLRRLMDDIHETRMTWLHERRRQGRQGWFNSQNKPAEEYSALVDDEATTTMRSN